METPFPTTCRCGETWSAEQWLELPLVGEYEAGRDGRLELRTCVCGATLAIPRTPRPSK